MSAEQEPEFGWGSRPEKSGTRTIHCPGHDWHQARVAYRMVPCTDSSDYLIRIEDPAGRWEDTEYAPSLEEAEDAVAGAALQSLMAEHCTCLRKLSAVVFAGGMMTEREHQRLMKALVKVEERVVAIAPENVEVKEDDANDSAAPSP